MVVHQSFQTKNQGFRRRNTGFALITVLALLVIITGLVLAFLGSVRTNSKLAGGFVSGNRAKLLTDTAIQHAMGTIRQATCGTDPLQGWASQPGMIRTFDTLGNVTVYKLYTSDQPVLTGTQVSSFNPSDDYGLGIWTAEPELFTDLNAPVQNSSGVLIYPIIDPSVESSSQGTQSSTDGVEGFSYTPANTGSGTDPVPMPVKWVYVLQDGTLTMPQSGTNKVAVWSGPGSPTATNPIVGRFSYWIDDETCKLNVNTSSEGAAWSRPIANNQTELALGNSVPFTNEYQRYPGHPAKTCLSPVLESVLPVPTTPDIPTANFPPFEPYYNLVPYISLTRGTWAEQFPTRRNDHGRWRSAF